MAATHGDKLELILDAAYRVFGTAGFYETKMSEIADAAGIAKGTLYLYFSSKEALFMAVTKRDFEHFLERLHEVLHQEGALEEKLHGAASHHLWYYYQVKHYPRLFFHAPNSDAGLMEMMHGFIRKYNAMLAQMLEAHEVKQAELHARSFIGILDVFKMDILMDPTFSEDDLRERARFAVQLFSRGCEAGSA
ncbi:helix-turn-helix transcriptional regulator [Paenibacillus sp. IB182496]|uniref:Helix-turn-helix transcriptional regulator n=1 Tax=Paenibacillus sabuli TaxID=2772509 RepID=A0A927BSM5_9BACL|nr:TetR/AcrR family transcriptional regulator [Paenibacillus sabuli]MBD2846027.1 helix-turn-helix transcriptional regulator [Paenibacillus sabuli]